jgi:uncharacterized protein (TIGR03435 family)
MKKLALSILIATLAQPADFEVASIKPTSTRDGSFTTNFAPGGRFSCRNMDLQKLLRIAYELQDYQISGGPPWFTSAGFDIQAKAAATSVEPTREQMRAMLQALLTDRFHLALHRETRQLPIYALVVVKSGPKLQAAAPNAPQTNSSRLGHILTQRMSIAELASILTFDLKRPVRDQTGLKGEFAFTLDWTPGLADSSDGPSVFAAVQEQLGLKLESTKGPIEVLIIDHSEKPSEN